MKNYLIQLDFQLSSILHM